MDEDAVNSGHGESSSAASTVDTTACGPGAAAASILKTSKCSSEPSTPQVEERHSPKPPPSPPSGKRPRSCLKQGAESGQLSTRSSCSISEAEKEERWRRLLTAAVKEGDPSTPKGAAERVGKQPSEPGKDALEADEAVGRCIALATQLEAAAGELLVASRAAGLQDAVLRRLVCENLFGSPPPNPQDGASGQASLATGPYEYGRSSASRSLAVVPGLHDHGALFLCKHVEGSPWHHYKKDEKVGEGSFAAVLKATQILTGHTHAIKTIAKSRIRPEELWAEIAVMKQLDHAHIIRLYATFEDETHIYTACEMCYGGEFFDTIEENGCLGERTAERLFKQILSAVNYLHGKSICHRDLKPENFLVSKKTTLESRQLKLTDFGTAKHFDTRPMVTKICTANYVAPEVLKKGHVPYTEKVDVWSCGVILYMMLCGYMPFHHTSERELMKLVKKGQFEFKPSKIWDLISVNAKALIRGTLCVNIEDRLNSSQAYHHAWFELMESEGDQNHNNLWWDEKLMMRQVTKFLTENRLKKVALQIIARQAEDESIERLRDIFLSADEDNSGTLTTQEMDECLKRLDVSEKARLGFLDVMRCLASEDSSTAEIEYTEFIAATMTPNVYAREDVCKSAFHLLDVDEDGTLSREDLYALLSNDENETKANDLSKSSRYEIEHIMHQLDSNGDGGLDFKEFLALMLDDTPPVTATAQHRLRQQGKPKFLTDINLDDLENPELEPAESEDDEDDEPGSPASAKANEDWSPKSKMRAPC